MEQGGDMRVLTIGMAMLLLPPSAFAQVQNRQFHDGVWQHVGGIPGGVESELLNPTPMAVTQREIILYDFADQRVKAFSHEGNLLWAVGRAGAGPREFRNPTDLQRAPDGTIWITDPSNQRLSIIGDEGEFAKLVRIPASVRRCAPISNAACWAMSFANEVFLLRLDTTGAVAERVDPPSWLANVPPYVREGFIMATPTGMFAIVAFLYSDRWMRIDAAPTRLHLFRGLAPTEFPRLMQYQSPRGVITRVDTTASEVVKTIAVSPSRVFILSATVNEGFSDIVDTYWVVNGEYAGSFRLPQPAHRIALTPDGNIVALLADANAAPEVKIWRFEPAPRGPDAGLSAHKY
jgi:hypothetical protein